MIVQLDGELNILLLIVNWFTMIIIISNCKGSAVEECRGGSMDRGM